MDCHARSGLAMTVKSSSLQGAFQGKQSHCKALFKESIVIASRFAAKQSVPVFFIHNEHLQTVFYICE